jgi:hypothetical protein
LTADSLEAIVTKVVKNWEVESHHIKDSKHWKTMDVEKFEFFGNDRKCPFSAETMANIGPYNLLLGKSEYFDNTKETNSTAKEIFSSAFGKGFPFEVLEVHSGPPNVSFTWRHFGEFSGEFTGPDGTKYPPTGKIIELFGHCLARLNKDLVIESLETYFDRERFLKNFVEGEVKA